MTWLAILGIGEDGVEGLVPAARAWIERAELVVGGARHLALARPSVRCLAWPSPIDAAFPEILAQRFRPTVVLASGDPFCFGVGSLLAELVARDEMICIPAPSAFSLACAQLGWAAQTTTTISFCGRRLETIFPLLQPGRRLLCLSAGVATPAALAALLRGRGFGPSRMHVLQALGGPRQQMFTAEAEMFGDVAIDALNVVGLDLVARADALVIPMSSGLPDHLFEHDRQITKREIRAVTLSALAPRAGEHLWDIGCGSGSVGIEWMLRHPANTVDAIERDPDRADRARRNAVALGVPGLRVLEAEAPGALKGLSPPDAVFIGGGAGEAVIEAAWSALRVGGRLVINAVTLETTRILYDLPSRLGGGLTRLAIERLDDLGTMQGFRPAMAVTQYVAIRT